MDTPGVVYLLTAEDDDTPVRGNASASGDDALDKKIEDEIFERLRRGDVWAWANIKVTAQIKLNGQYYEGYDCLGGCSYDNAEDFKAPGGYWDDMKQAALDDLKRNLQRYIEESKHIRRWLRDNE